MARSAVVAGNYKYSGTDTHRKLLSVGSLWQHHLHDVERDPCTIGQESITLL